MDGRLNVAEWAGKETFLQFFTSHTYIYVAFYLFDSIYSDTDGINAFYAYSYKYRKDWSELKQQYKREKTPSVCPTYIHISYNCCCCFISLYFLCLFKPHRHTTLKPETNMPFRIGRVFVYLFRCTGYKKKRRRRRQRCDRDGDDFHSRVCKRVRRICCVCMITANQITPPSFHFPFRL